MQDAMFRLCFSEGYEDEPRICTRVSEVGIENYAEPVLLVKIDPPLSDAKYRRAGELVEHLLLSPRFAGHIFPWPEHVHVLVPMIDNPHLRDHFVLAEVSNIGFATMQRIDPPPTPKN